MVILSSNFSIILTEILNFEILFLRKIPWMSWKIIVDLTNRNKAQYDKFDLIKINYHVNTCECLKFFLYFLDILITIFEENVFNISEIESIDSTIWDCFIFDFRIDHRLFWTSVFLSVVICFIFHIFLAEILICSISWI
jgi:hypothetical protein